MNAAGIRKVTTVIVLLALAVCFIALDAALSQEEAYAAVAKAAVKKAKTYKKPANKLFKVGKGWYCFSKKKVRKGLQKVGKDYYFFSKSTGKMYLKTGLKQIGTSYYYFNKTKGKAPALRNKARTLDNAVWFFQSDGRRYPYSYSDTGSAEGNTAAGYIISEAQITDKDPAAAYQKIVARSTYQVLISDPITSSGVIGKYALTAAQKKGGKCYHLAALTFVTFKAMGENPSLITGKCARTGSAADNIEHAWVENDDLVYDSVFDMVDNKGGAEMAFMGKEKESLQGKEYNNREFKLTGAADLYKNYMYTPDREFN